MRLTGEKRMNKRLEKELEKQGIIEKEEDSNEYLLIISFVIGIIIGAIILL